MQKKLVSKCTRAVNGKGKAKYIWIFFSVFFWVWTKISTKLHVKMEKCCCVVFRFSFLQILLLCVSVYGSTCFLLFLNHNFHFKWIFQRDRLKLPFQLAMQIILFAPQFHLVWFGFFLVMSCSIHFFLEALFGRQKSEWREWQRR